MRCEPYIKQMDQAAGARVTALTGCAPTCDHGPKILWWMHERPEDFRRIAKFVTPASYVAGNMCGLKADQAFMDYTFIHFSGFADTAALAWSEELCATFGLDMAKLPQIVEPWKVVGEVAEAAARDFGLAPGTPVAAGCGDTAACALGAGAVRPGIGFDTAGTAAVFAAGTEHFVADQKYRALMCMHSVIPGLYNPLAYVAGGGLALRWFRNQFYCASKGQAQTPDDDVYDEMIALAAQTPPGADGLLFSPHLGGRICPASPAMRGAWVGFSWSHSQGHFLRAVLESVAFEYAFYLKIIRDQVPDLEMIETRVVGGGANSRVWNQIKADALGVPYQRLGRTELGTWGGALIAGKAVGLFDDLAAKAMECTQPAGAPFRPVAETQAVYAPLLERYIKLQSNLDGYFSD
jgi:xylulokinase